MNKNLLLATILLITLLFSLAVGSFMDAAALQVPTDKPTLKATNTPPAKATSTPTVKPTLKATNTPLPKPTDTPKAP